MVTSLRTLYTVLWYFLLPRVFLRLLWRSRQNPAYRTGWMQRLGFFQPKHPQAQRLWLHAVSVGEVGAAVPLVQALRARYPEIDIVVTTTTPTGAETVQQRLGGQVQHCYFPFDIPTGIARFVKRVQPGLVIIMETELWPNLLRSLCKRRIPAVLMNARLSEKAYGRYRLLREVMASVLNDFTVIAAQTRGDADRFIALGADAERVSVLGNLKFDTGIPADRDVESQRWRAILGNKRVIWVAASTHPEEEAIMLRAQRTFITEGSDALLVLVPRHPERFKAVFELCHEYGLATVRYSERRHCPDDTQVFLLDTMGELTKLYTAADVAVVGGSFCNTGGHNPLEPASLAVPIISGPQVFNFEDIYARLQEAGGAVVVADEIAMTAEVRRLLNDRNAAHHCGACAQAVFKEHGGSLARAMAIIEEQLGARLQLLSRDR